MDPIFIHIEDIDESFLQLKVADYLLKIWMTVFFLAPADSAGTPRTVFDDAMPLRAAIFLAKALDCNKLMLLPSTLVTYICHHYIPL